MKQYYITSKDFRLDGDDSSIPDNYVDPVQLAAVKKMAGIDSLGIMARHMADLAETKELYAKKDPSEMSGSDKAEYQRVNDIKVGSDKWFQLWYAKPSITGEKPI
jgi:hypothetical protein